MRIKPGQAFRPCCAQARARIVRAQAQATSAAQPRIDIHGKHLKVTDSISEYVHRKVGQSAEPFQQVLRDIDVQLSARGGGEQTKGAKEQRIEITIRTRRYGVVRAEECQYDMYAAIDLASDKITRSLRKLKEKAVKKGNWPGRGSKRGEERISEFMTPDESDLDDVDPNRAESVRGYGYAPTDDEVQDAKAQLEFPESVKRTKVFYLEPMTLREAIDQLDAVDHDFYIYLDADSQHVQCVYRRQEGGHGVLITIPDNAEMA